MPRSSILAVVALGGGLVGGALVWTLGPPTPVPSTPGTRRAPEAASFEDLRRSVARLELELELAHARREEIAEELGRLASRLPPSTPVAADAPRPVAGASEPTEAAATRLADAGERASLDEAALLRAGFDERDVEALRARLDAARLDRLYLRDQAAREGWLGTPRFYRESREIAESLSGVREELGDAFYDWALYASGRPNRVVVSEVMQGSAAAAAGLAPGDVVVRYGESPIFASGELRSRTTTGIPGETTPVEVLREGETLRVYMPRGPLGVTVAPSRREPPPAG